MFVYRRAGLLVTIFVVLATFSQLSLSQSEQTKKSFSDCLVKQIKESSGDINIQDIETFCVEKVVKMETNVKSIGALGKKIIEEKEAELNRYVIASYKQNYVLPFAHSNNVNSEAYEALGSWADDFRNGEAIFQISYKIPLASGGLFKQFDGLYFGMTLKSWWQVYAKESSRQFRETNYEPELFYVAPVKANFLGGNLGFLLGLSHQSNGRSQLLSRSWNRVYAGFIYEKENFALNLRPWYRVPEKDKEFPGDAEGDDNPDIDQFMGNFDLTAVRRFGGNELSVLFRNNLRSENKGAIEIGYSFPFPKSNLKGFVQYFNGYGESLIDYNHHQERIGIGILLTDFL